MSIQSPSLTPTTLSSSTATINFTVNSNTCVIYERLLFISFLIELLLDRKFKIDVILSYTQNLAAVLSDTRRTRSEVAAFFFYSPLGGTICTKTKYSPSQTIPSITLEHFRQYLATTAKKHKQYLKTRRALRQQKQGENGCGEEEKISKDEVAEIFFSPTFSRHTQHTFESIFLEPKFGETDNLLSLIEKRKELLKQKSINNTNPFIANPFIERHESCGSLNSIQSTQQQHQQQFPIEASNGRFFRSFSRLQQRLEYYDDKISTLLNQQLENRNEQFWKSVNSYEVLHDDLEESIERIKIARQKLLKAKLELCQRSQNLLQLYYSKINRERLLDKLKEIACLRDAQITVQMLLNQDDVPRALECIQTAMEVLGADLRAVNCFRHLDLQLEETKKMIGKMLLEEFEQVIQKEFSWPIEQKWKKKTEKCEEEEEEEEMSNLYPIVYSLTRCHEFRFLAILREEITATIKNSVKQAIKSQILIYLDDETIGYNPTTLSEHICKLTDEQWSSTIFVVINCLILLCNKIKFIQQLIIKCIEQTIFEESEHKNSRSNSINKSKQTSGASTPSISNGYCGQSLSDKTLNQPPLPSGGGSLLSLSCHNLSQLRAAALQLIGHSIYLCEERISKRIQARFKDNVLEKCTPLEFHKTCEAIDKFRQNCKQLDECGGQQRSPSQAIIQQITNKFLSKFTEARQRELSSTIDAETWKPAHINANIQLMVNCFVSNGFLTTIINKEEIKNNEKCLKETLQLKEENYIIIGSSLLLVNILASYNDILNLFPNASMELIMDVVQCLKLFNSRTCQLILGAGARQLVGLKTINVKHLALASRSLQLILKFIPSLKQSFSEHLPVERQISLRHFDSTARDYADHIGEIKSKLLGMMDRELLISLEEWKPEGKSPTPQFQQIVMQIGKFYSSYSAIMPPELTTEMLHLIHENLKLYFKQNVHSRGVSFVYSNKHFANLVTPHDSIAYGMAGQDFAYYMENIRALPNCQSFPEDSISDTDLP
ncbi:hypothetical protein Mgra_00007329 [Meloidogyne graminicola]|uniref:Vacuolar protein sorting-associated protein 54 n=1 Tax=Meloidogyne graminicola TaxID=189291 RepID=A0A8S9ZIS5_9BILA|nr:hypothetical protein Mgra_00007329 [Meloidogyne graminicola]